MLSVRIKLFVLTLIVCSCSVTIAHAAYRVELTITGLSDSTVQLFRYHGSEREKVTEAKLDSRGRVVFADKKNSLLGGIHVLGSAGSEIEFLASGDKDFTVSIFANVKNVDSTLVYKNSKVNEGFKKFSDNQNWLIERGQELQLRYMDYQMDADSMKMLQAEMNRMMSVRDKLNQNLIKDYKGSVLATLVKSTIEPKMPEVNIPKDFVNPDSLRWAAYANFAKAHFFDNITFSDPSVIYMPMMENRVSVFFQQILRKAPVDTIKRAIDKVLLQAGANKEVYREVLTWLYQCYKTSPEEGHYVVAIYVGSILANSPKVDWLSSKEKDEIKRRVRLLGLNPVGSIATDLMLQTPEGEFRSLHKTKATYTVLYFFNPDCGNCRVVTPVLHDLYEQYKDKGLAVFAVYPDKKKDIWTKYIADKNLEDWINVWDAEGTADIAEKYSLHAIPLIYFLDESKKVLSKDIDVDALSNKLSVAFGR